VNPGATALVDVYDRRNVLRLPASDAGAGIDHRLPRRMSASPFAQGTTLANIDARIASGADVQLVEDPSGADVPPLASVGPDATVNLKPDSRSIGTEDTIIGLVGTINDTEHQLSGGAQPAIWAGKCAETTREAVGLVVYCGAQQTDGYSFVIDGQHALPGVTFLSPDEIRSPRVRVCFSCAGPLARNRPDAVAPVLVGDEFEAFWIAQVGSAGAMAPK
jgi:hypothetical protein